jgi:hypothetical protein
VPLIEAAHETIPAEMRRLIGKLLLLLAVLAMPLGMTAAPAAAAEHHSAAMPVQRCPGEGQSQDMRGGFAKCTMACAAALPAFDAMPADAAVPPEAKAESAVAPMLDGIQPDIATPPPKRS